MKITIHDLRRAILNGGDISSFAEIYHHALGDPPVSIISNFDLPMVLPQPLSLLANMDKQLSAVTTHLKNEKENSRTSLSQIDFRIAAVSTYGNNAGKYLERIIKETSPDIIAVGACPVELGAHILYACSLPYAVGLPLRAHITHIGSRQTYANSFFYPNNTIETALIESWLHNIPVFPIGYPLKPIQLEFDPWGGHFDPDYADKNTWESKQYVANTTFEDNVKADCSLQDANNLAKEAGLELLSASGTHRRSAVMEEAGYISSRIVDIAASTRAPDRNIRLLAIVDIAHYIDVAEITSQLSHTAMHDIYFPQKSETADGKMVMAAEVLDNLDRTNGENMHETARAQELFKEQLGRFVRDKNAEVLPESEADALLATIAERVRTHPDVARGLSVRGTIAFKEVLGGLSEIHGTMTGECLTKAAFIALPPRISLKQKGDETAVIGDIIKKVLYRFTFHKGNGNSRGLSATDMLSALHELNSLPPEQSENMLQGKSPAVMSEAERNQESLTYLEEMDFVRMDEHGQYVFTKNALEFLMDGLEEKLKSGAISLEEYHQQKSSLMQHMQQLGKTTEAQPGKGEPANTIMEMIDAQDKQWNSNVNFSTMYVYYHIKAGSERNGLDPQKCDYYGLKRIMDDLIRQKILVGTEDPSTCNLTGFALDVLLKYLIGNNLKGAKVQEVTDHRARLHNERSHEIRRYRSGDNYRNISVRRTLREIARQRKSLSDVRQNDFRVFIARSCKPKSDIILCLDTSGSMGFNQKLMFARLVAAGIVQSAIRDGNRVGIVAFNDYGKVALPLTECDEDALLDFIAKVSPRGNTNIGDGIKYSMEALVDHYSRNQKHIIVISDGLASAISESTLDKLTASKGRDMTEESALLETKKAGAKGAQVSVLHIAGKGEASSKFIHAVARVGNGRVYRISDSKALTTLFS